VHTRAACGACTAAARAAVAHAASAHAARAAAARAATAAARASALDSAHAAAAHPTTACITTCSTALHTHITHDAINCASCAANTCGAQSSRRQCARRQPRRCPGARGCRHDADRRASDGRCHLAIDTPSVRATECTWVIRTARAAHVPTKRHEPCAAVACIQGVTTGPRTSEHGGMRPHGLAQRLWGGCRRRTRRGGVRRPRRRRPFPQCPGHLARGCRNRRHMDGAGFLGVVEHQMDFNCGPHQQG
jgi:hypothetical protein